MKTLLITGGAGFIGSNLVQHVLANSDYRVVNLDKLTYAGNLQSLAALKTNPYHIFVHGCILDRNLLVQLFNDYRPDAVLNLAAESHVDRSITGPETFIQTNIVGTFTLLDCAYSYWQQQSPDQQSRFRFLQVSTDEVYGSLPATGYFTETTAYAPNSPYSASKAAADHLARAYQQTYGLPVLITNCSNNYGPYQFPEKLIPLTIINALAQQSIPVYGDGNQVRDWLYVEDHCRALMTVLAKGIPGEAYNIGGNSEQPNLAVVNLICEILNVVNPRSNRGSYCELIKFVNDRPGHDRRYAIDATKIRNQLDWQPTESFDHGLAKTVAWYLNNEDWWRQIQSGAYCRPLEGNSSD